MWTYDKEIPKDSKLLALINEVYGNIKGSSSSCCCSSNLVVVVVVAVVVVVVVEFVEVIVVVVVVKVVVVVVVSVVVVVVVVVVIIIIVVVVVVVIVIVVIENNSGLMLGPLIVDQKFKGRGIGKELVNKSIGVINEKNIDFIILIGEFDYYGQFGFERNANVYFSLNVRKEKILLKKLSEQNNTFSGKIELY